MQRIGRAQSTRSESRKNKRSEQIPARRPRLSAGRAGARVDILEQRQLLSTSWFVSPSGSNNNPGTLAAPFQSIQAAANVARPGDFVEIETGTYHETVVPASSGTSAAPIVYEAYKGESVTISGADPITGWSNDTGDIYDAPMSWDLGEGNNEVFVDGQAINEAAWPNSAIGNFSHPVTATMTSATVSGNTAVIYDSALNQAANYWKGAIIHMDPGQAWIDQTATVTSSSPGSITISFINNGSYYLPGAGDPFYLFGKFQDLNGAGQWYRDPTSGLLYAWMPDSGNPAAENVEVKRRLYAFNLGSVHDITIHDINFFAATISTSGSSSDIVINGVTAMYPTQQMLVPNGWIVPGNDGISLAGSNSIVENSIVAFSSGDGIVLLGSHCSAVNNIVHDVAYAGANTGAILVNGTYDTIDHNTIYNSGRDGVLIQAAHDTITYNTVHDVGLQTTEPGGIYTANINGQGAVIAYNTVYNIHTGGYGGTALFLDNDSSNWIVHNNVTYNVDYGLKMNFTCNGNVIYNNTLGATGLSIGSNQKGDWDGTKIYNNIYTAGFAYTSGVSAYNNATSSASASSSQGAGSFTSGTSGTVGASGVANSGASSGGGTPPASGSGTTTASGGGSTTAPGSGTTTASGSGSTTASGSGTTTASGSGSTTASGSGTTTTSGTGSTAGSGSATTVTGSGKSSSASTSSSSGTTAGSAGATSTGSSTPATTVSPTPSPLVLDGPWPVLPPTITTTSSSSPPTVADLQAQVTADQAAIADAIKQRKQTIQQLLATRKSDLAAVHTATKQLANARHASKVNSSAGDAPTDVSGLSTDLLQLRQTVQADTALIDTDLRSDFTGIFAKKKILANDMKALHSLMHAARKVKATA